MYQRRCLTSEANNAVETKVHILRPIPLDQSALDAELEYEVSHSVILEEQC